MNHSIIHANELNIRTWEELIEVRDSLEYNIKHPDLSVNAIIEDIDKRFIHMDSTSTRVKFPRGFWKTNKVLKSYLIAKKTYEYIGKSHKDIILDDFRPYCAVGFHKIFGNTYKMMCLILGERLQLSDMKNYTTKITETQSKLIKYHNVKLSELDMTMLGFRDLLDQYLYTNYQELFESMGIHSKYILFDPTIKSHKFNILITSGVSYDKLYDYMMSFKSVMGKYKIDDREVLCRISKHCGFIEKYRLRRYIKKISVLMPSLNIKEFNIDNESYFDILTGEADTHNTLAFRMSCIEL